MRDSRSYSDRDLVRRFLSERCVTGEPASFETSAALADAYTEWLGPSSGSRDRDLLWKNLGAEGYRAQTRRLGRGVRSRGYAAIRLLPRAVAESEPEPEAEDVFEQDREAQLASLAEFRKALEG